MKSKKNKQRRHQLKKSKRGQVRKRKPKAPGILPSRFSDDENPLDNVVFMKAPRRGVPIAADGYRIVGPAQALMDYARPLIEEIESEEEMNQALGMAQACWALGILKRREPEKVEETRKRSIKDFPNLRDKLDMMVERFDQMFPDVGREPSFYIKERVIDVEEYEPFDESTLHISEETIPPTEEEKNFAKRLSKLDPDEDEDKLSAWNSDVVNCYAEWCFAKGVPDDKIRHFAGPVDNYLHFLNHYNMEVPSSDTPTGIVREFMHTFYIRKTWAPAREKSTMPAALKLFMQYLDEKGIVSGTKRVRRIIESEQDTFQRNLRLYNDPSQGKKAIPFRRKRK